MNPTEPFPKPGPTICTRCKHCVIPTTPSQLGPDIPAPATEYRCAAAPRKDYVTERATSFHLCVSVNNGACKMYESAARCEAVTQKPKWRDRVEMSVAWFTLALCVSAVLIVIVYLGLEVFEEISKALNAS